MRKTWGIWLTRCGLAAALGLTGSLTQAQTLTGNNISIQGSGISSDVLLQTDGTYTSGYVGNSDQVIVSTQSSNAGTVVRNSYLETSRDGLALGTSATLTMYQGAVDGATGYVTTPNGIYMDSNKTALFSQGSSQATVTGWVSSYANTSSLSQVNGMVANNNGVVIQSATALSLSGATINMTGATSINTTGTANTAIGNSTGSVTVTGGAVNVATNSGSTIGIGSTSANSTVSLNGNRLQNVGAATAGTDAVNLNQLNALTASSSAQFTQLQSQIQVSEKGIAGVSAMSNIPSLAVSQQYNFGVGIGSFSGSTALAVGGNWRIKENLIAKFSAGVSANTYVTGIGLSLGF